MAQLIIDPRQALQHSCRRHTVVLFKEFLAILEQLAEEHDEALAKLATVLPPEYHPHINLADHFTEEKGERLRRAVLQRGNDAARAIQEEIEHYEIDFHK